MINRDELESALKDAERLERSYRAPTSTWANEQIVIEETPEAFEICVSGSTDLRDWLQNFSAWRWWNPRTWFSDQVSWQARIPGTSYYATSGYVNAVGNVIRAIDRDDTKISKNKAINLSGHSAGGPKAALVAIELDRQGFSIRNLRTIGAPRWSTSKINIACINRMKRYETRADYIPTVPKTKPGRGWKAFGYQYQLGAPDVDYVLFYRDFEEAYRAHKISTYREEIQKELLKHTEEMKSESK